MPPSASKGPNSRSEVRYTRHSGKHPECLTMDWRKGELQRHMQSSFPLGCIFDNPVAFEDSFNRRKIDCGSNIAAIDMLECQIRALDIWGEGRDLQKLASRGRRPLVVSRHKEKLQRKGAPEYALQENGYDPSRSVSYSCRRKLCLDTVTATPTAVLPSGASSPSTSADTSITPLLDDCEIYSDNSSPFVELNLAESLTARSRECRNDAEPCTPARDVLSSPASSSASLRSLDGLDSVIENRAADIKLEDIDRDFDASSRGGSYQGMQSTAKDGLYFIYPGWSMWSREQSYRSLKQESPLSSSCVPSLGEFPGIRSLKTSLHQHLIAAAGQCHRISSAAAASRSSSTRTILSAGSVRTLESSYSNKNAGYCGKHCGPVLEDAKLSLLKPQRTVKRHFSPRKNWEPVTFFRRGLKSLASKAISHDSFSVPSVVPIPGSGIPKIEESLLLKPKKLLPERQSKSFRTVSQEAYESSGSLESTTGYLQCMLRHGLTSYSFWMDEDDEVFVAKPEHEERRDKCISFYTCKGNERHGWRQWQKIRKRVVNLVATMDFSCYVYTEVNCKGETMHYMDSEFSLFDERLQKNPGSTASAQKKSKPCRSIASSYLRGFWRNSWERNEFEAGTRCKKELSAMVIRAPLEVKRSDNSRSGPLQKPAEKLPKPETSWSRIAGTPGESLHVILPTGEHGHPAYGLEGPRPLVERWRSGGLCDCGSWDLGCGMITLSRDHSSTTNDNQQQPDKLPLNVVVEGSKQKIVALSLAPCQDGLFRLSFQRPMLALQAFAAAVAVLHSKLSTRELQHYNKSQENQTKLPVTLITSRDKSSARSCHPNPPPSPIDRL